MDVLTAMAAVLPLKFVAAWITIGYFCCVLDAAFPVPRPNSRWIPIRRVISAMGVNVGFARNRVLPGSTDATITPHDIVRKVEETHAEAQVARAAILDVIAPGVVLKDTRA